MGEGGGGERISSGKKVNIYKMCDYLSSKPRDGLIKASTSLMVDNVRANI